MWKPQLVIFLLMILASPCIIAQLPYDFYISNKGSDTNSGTSPVFAKRTLGGAAEALKAHAKSKGSVAVGLEESNTFSEAIDIGFPINLGSYNTNTLRPTFAILDGADKFDTGWTKVPGTANSYCTKIKYIGFEGSGINGIGNYSFIYVTEIDKSLEHTQPLTARKVLQYVASKGDVEAVNGSFYEPVVPLGSPDKTIDLYIHTSNSVSPSGNPKYRYEVTTRDRGINGYVTANNVFQNLWVSGYGGGYGLLPSGSNSLFSKVIFGPGAAIHHVVTKNGSFNNCLFLPTGENIGGGALVFYDVEGFHRCNTVSNSIFLDINSPVYSHNSNGSNYDRLTIKNVVAFGDSNKAKIFAGALSNDSVTFEGVSTYGFYSGYALASAKYFSVRNSNFHFSGDAISFGPDAVEAIIDNVFVSGKQQSRCIKMDQQTDLKVTSSVLMVATTFGDGSCLAGSGLKANKLQLSRNILIGNVNDNNVVLAGNTYNGGGDDLNNYRDSNVYIRVHGKFYWDITTRNVPGSSPLITSVPDWQRQSGQDKHSLFFDLRTDPRGLKAVFLDAEHGNYTLANTVPGNKIRALGAGMKTPLHCFLKKPTYEEAAEMIKNDKVPAADDCRNPCQQNKVRLTTSILPNVAGELVACQSQQVSFKGAGNYTQNDTYYHQSDERARYLWWFSDETDTAGTNLNSITHRFKEGKPTTVRLQMVDENGCDFDTAFTVTVHPQPVKPGLVKDTFLCTGQTLPIDVRNREVGNRYRWSVGDTTPTLAVTRAGTYTVNVTNGFGCRIADTVKVANKTPIAVSIGPDTLFCASAHNLLTATATGAVASYEWSSGATTDTLRAGTAGTYAVTARDTGVCLARDTITLAANPVNNFWLPNDTTICAGTVYDFHLSKADVNDLAWSDSSYSFSRSLPPGVYSIVAHNLGCEKRDTITIGSQPLPVVHLPADTVICSGYRMPLAVSYPGARYVWSTGSTDRQIIVTSKNSYWVQATINGCSFRDTIAVGVRDCDCNFEMFNAFSPNGDGINDIIRPKMSCFPTDYNLSIFNRYGQLVFSTTNQSSGWDGTTNGQPAPVGTYYYIIKMTNAGYPVGPKSGSITLLR